MRTPLYGVFSFLSFAAGPLFAQAPPPALPVPYQGPPSATAPASYEPPPPLPPPSTTTTTVYQAPPPPPPPASLPIQPSEPIAPPAGAVPVIPNYGPPPGMPMRLIPVDAEPYHVWMRADLMLWWVKNTPMPAPIATVSDAAGNSTTAIGGGNTSFGAFTGGRFALGVWFDHDNTIGFEATFFGLERRTNTQSVFSDGNGNPQVGLSFLNAAPGQSGEFIQPLSVPGQFGGGVPGLPPRSKLRGTRSLMPAFCFLRSGGFEVIGLAGFRYLDLRENLYIYGDLHRFDER